MKVIGLVKKGAYFDSVTLMRVARETTGIKGVLEASAVMGTASNKAILQSSGLLLPEFKHAGDTDLLLAIKAQTPAIAQAAIAQMEATLKESRKKAPEDSAQVEPADLDDALQTLPGANLALISLAGRYAGREAHKAIEKGLHVMLFSDNVSIETEVELKQMAQKKGLLVMGPDCGTAIINGVPLAFANVVNRGPIGVVAAAGTGLQEVTCIISNEGEGISQALGTGGRDVKKAVGGIMFLEAMKALAADPDTKVILLISKPPEPEVLTRINQLIRQIKKPVVPLLLGASSEGSSAPATLEEAALTAVALSRGGRLDDVKAKLEGQAKRIRLEASRLVVRVGNGRRYLRGLFSGGTFCAEAQILLTRNLKGVYSNAPTAGAQLLKNALKSQKHTLIDLGEDEFTVGRPHPMIDYTLRNRRILDEAADKETAVILLDVVLGFGSNMDPSAELSPIIHDIARKVLVICSVTGTDRDPQNRTQVVKSLEAAGAVVMPSNAAACLLAGQVIQMVQSGK